MQKRVKTIGLSVFLLVVLGGAVYFGQNVPGMLGMLSRASSCPVKAVATQQVTGNSAVVAWQTDDATQGQVQYGTTATSLAMSAPETTTATSHNVPLTLLTPSTVYYYVVKVGDATCDSSGQTCTDGCVPWSFTTSSITPQKETVTTIPPAASGSGSTSMGGLGNPAAEPTSGTSAFCTQVKDHLGASSKDAAGWTEAKQYDMDNNGIVNGKDIIKCNASGK